jgi:hypothetical protein
MPVDNRSSLNWIPVIRDFAVRVTPIFTSKKARVKYLENGLSLKK